MTRIENNRNETIVELNDRELDGVSGGDSLLKYAVLEGVRKGMAETCPPPSNGFGASLG